MFLNTLVYLTALSIEHSPDPLPDTFCLLRKVIALENVDSCGVDKRSVVLGMPQTLQLWPFISYNWL